MVACLFYVVYNIHNKNVYSIEKTGGYTVREIRLKARAKINLTLDVTGKREDGYHLLETIMQTVALYDGIYMKKLEKPVIKLKTNLPWLPTDARNLAWKAANLMRETFDSTVSFQLAGVKDAPRLVDLMTGDVYQVPETLVKRDDLGNVVELVNLPLTDSPLLLMFGDFDD